MNESSNDDILMLSGKGKETCPCLVVFLRLLLKYLQARGDTKTADVLKRKIRICTELNLRQEPGYECVAEAVLREIPRIVPASELRSVQALVQARAKRKATQAQNESKAPENTTEDSTDSNCANFDVLSGNTACV